MKIVFVTLNDRPMLPYNYVLFRSYCEQDESLRGFSWQAIYDARVNTHDLLNQIEEPDVVALSCYMWNTKRTLYLAKLIKEKYPNCKILAGGPDIYDNNFLYEYPWLDILVYGEGEETFKEYLLGYDLDDIMGISYIKNGELKSNPERIRSTKPFLDTNVYQNKLLDPHVEYLKSRYNMVWALLETNRGCPYSCSFCDLGVSAMSKVRQVCDEDVYSQIDYFSRHEISNILITDSNFGAFHRDLTIIDRIAKSKDETGYPKSLYATWAKNSNERVFEVSKKLKDHQLGWGTTLSVQSMDEQVLSAIARKNIPLTNYTTLHKKYAENKIPTYTEIILGLPLETKQSFIEGRIKEIEAIISLADVIDPAALSGAIKFGATVTLVDEDTDEEKTWQIVGEHEANIEAGLLNIKSPIARALIGKDEGDNVEVKTPGGEKAYEILKIEYK